MKRSERFRYLNDSLFKRILLVLSIEGQKKSSGKNFGNEIFATKLQIDPEPASFFLCYNTFVFTYNYLRAIT